MGSPLPFFWDFLPMAFYAHTGQNSNRSDWQTLEAHLQGAAALALAKCQDSFPGNSLLRDQLTVSAWLHDLGKYRKGFQDYLYRLVRSRKLVRNLKVQHLCTSQLRMLLALNSKFIQIRTQALTYRYNTYRYQRIYSFIINRDLRNPFLKTTRQRLKIEKESSKKQRIQKMEQFSVAESLPNKIKSIKRLIKEEYFNANQRPWLIGFSGGKDSTILLHLVIEVLMNIAPDQRTRHIYIISNDTRVESPVYLAQVNKTLERLKVYFETYNLPATVNITTPNPEKTFWVNMLGKGYPAPNRVFRWCTDRMKIEPTTYFIKNIANKSGECLLFLGVRKAESGARSARITGYQEKAKNEFFNKHNDIQNCTIFTPIVNLMDDEVWQTLLSCPPPWGGTHRDLVTLYRNGKGGECPFILGKDDAPSCGTGSARFGCWTCTVVDKDSSLDGLIDSGFEYLEPLADFRNLLREVSNNPANRLMVRRTGEIGPGPLTIETRKMLLQKLLEIQENIQMELIELSEIRTIKDWWQKDETTSLFRQVNLIKEK